MLNLHEFSKHSAKPILSKWLLALLIMIRFEESGGPGPIREMLKLEIGIIIDPLILAGFFSLGCMKSFFEIFFMHHYLTASLSGKCRFKKTGQYFVRSCVIFLRHIYYLYTPHYFVLVHEAVQYFYHNGPRTLLQLRPLIVLIHQWSYISCLHAVAFATYILWNKQNIIFL